MPVAKRIAREDLTRDPAGILRAVREGEMVVVEHRGEAQAAIVDPVDLQILKSVISYYVERSRIAPEAGLNDPQLAGVSGPARVDMALAHYLAGAISLSRAAEVLETSWTELSDRFSRLGIPLRTAPVDIEDAKQDVLVAVSTVS